MPCPVCITIQCWPPCFGARYALGSCWWAEASRLLAGKVFAVVRKKIRPSDQRRCQLEFREVHERGGLSDEEFRTIKTLLAARLREGVKGQRRKRVKTNDPPIDRRNDPLNPPQASLRTRNAAKGARRRQRLSQDVQPHGIGSHDVSSFRCSKQVERFQCSKLEVNPWAKSWESPRAMSRHHAATSPPPPTKGDRRARTIERNANGSSGRGRIWVGDRQRRLAARRRRTPSARSAAKKLPPRRRTAGRRARRRLYLRRVHRAVPVDSGPGTKAAAARANNSSRGSLTSRGRDRRRSIGTNTSALARNTPRKSWPSRSIAITNG